MSNETTLDGLIDELVRVAGEEAQLACQGMRTRDLTMQADELRAQINEHVATLRAELDDVRKVGAWLDAQRGSVWRCIAVDGDGRFFAQQYGWTKFPTADSIPALGRALEGK